MAGAKQQATFGVLCKFIDTLTGGDNLLTGPSHSREDLRRRARGERRVHSPYSQSLMRRAGQQGSEIGPGVTPSPGASSARGHPHVSSHVGGPEVLVELARFVVLFQHPQIQPAVGIIRAAPRCYAGHQPRTGSSSLQLSTNMQIIQQRAPARVAAAVRARKSSDLRPFLLGNQNDLIGRRPLEPRSPKVQPVREDVAVEERVGQRAAIGASPALRVERRDFDRIPTALAAPCDNRGGVTARSSVGSSTAPGQQCARVATLGPGRHPP